MSELSGYPISFDKKKAFKKAVYYLLVNNFFKFGTRIYQQIIGIPVGSNPAPFMVNFFFSYYENEWIQNSIKKDFEIARRFGDIFHFVDNLTAMNDGVELDKALHKIYRPKLESKKGNESPFQASFLDLNIKILNKKFTLVLYNKRDIVPIV